MIYMDIFTETHKITDISKSDRNKLSMNVLFHELITKCITQVLPVGTEQTCNRPSGECRLHFTWVTLLTLQQGKKRRLRHISGTGPNSGGSGVYS